MRDWLVRAWYQGHAALWLLRPLSLLYGALSGWRRVAYAQGWKPVYHSRLPVIVVGNITVGGTGKTPTVLAVVRHLQAQGWRPVILSRGYGGASAVYPLQVQPDSKASVVGDEPLLLAQLAQVPVVVDPRRARAAAWVEAQQLGDVLVCDDGLQHYALGRCLEIVVIDGARGLGNGWLLPAGPLREPARRLAQVDCLVLNGEEQPVSSWPAVPAFHLQLRPQAWQSVGTQPARQPPQAGQRVHAVAGIGNPQRFFATLAGLGLQVIPHAFADHQAYQPQDLQFGDDLPVVMTAKDAVKCQDFALPSAWQLPVLAELDDGFFALLDQRLQAVARREWKD